jgi:Cytochrome c3
VASSASSRPTNGPGGGRLIGFALVLLALCLVPALARADARLVERHTAAGVACAGCHREAPPPAAAAPSVCVSCHGYAAVAAKTAKDEPNPHASHRGDLPCDSCHHVHKPSVDFCVQCHDFGFKVP